MIAPLAIRNHQVFGAYVLNNGGGVNLYLGNNELDAAPISTPRNRRLPTSGSNSTPRWARPAWTDI